MPPTRHGPCLSSAWLDLSGLIDWQDGGLVRRARPLTRADSCEWSHVDLPADAFRHLPRLLPSETNEMHEEMSRRHSSEHWLRRPLTWSWP